MDFNSREMKRTVPIPSVGAGREQPNDQINITSIAEKSVKSNCFDENYEEMLWQMRRMRDPSYLSTISMKVVCRICLNPFSILSQTLSQKSLNP